MTDKDTRRLLDQVERQGFVVKRLASGHFRISKADGTFVTTVAGTGSDWRGLKNARAVLRRHGFREADR